jgi:hypothetical protein
MAKIELTNVEVARVNRNGFGVQVVEARESNGKTFKQRYTLWFTEPHGLGEGDVVSVNGILGAKVGEPWTDKEGNTRQSVELSVNFPKLTTGGAEYVPASWNEVAPSGDEPF